MVVLSAVVEIPMYVARTKYYYDKIAKLLVSLVLNRFYIFIKMITSFILSQRRILSVLINKGLYLFTVSLFCGSC
jgi:hypothetical protein